MSGGPSIEVGRGAPSPEEEAAIRAAILKIWREDQASAMRGGGESEWVVAARAAALHTPIHQMPTAHAWRLSYRFGAGLVSARRTGRGDSR